MELDRNKQSAMVKLTMCIISNTERLRDGDGGKRNKENRLNIYYIVHCHCPDKLRNTVQYSAAYSVQRGSHYQFDNWSLCL